MIGVVIAVALAISIGIGYKTKINTGLIALCFAYLIGVFVMKMAPAEVIALWPISIFFTIFAVTLFFQIAVTNGTLERLAEWLLYRSRRLSWGLAFVFLLVAVLLAALGAGFFGVMVFLTPAILLMCRRMRMAPLIGAICVILGAEAGGNFMTSVNGVIYQGMFRQEGATPSTAFLYSVGVFFAFLAVVAVVTVEIVLYYRHRARRLGTPLARPESVGKPGTFTRQQIITLVLIGIFLVTLLVPNILHVTLPAATWIGSVVSKLDIGLLAVLFTVVGLLLGLSDSKATLAHVPWNILVMVSGMGIFVGVAVKAGTIKQIAAWLASGSIPAWLIPLTLALISAIITSFSSFIGVTAPALFPVAALVAPLSGLNPLLLYIAVVVGGLLTAISPYSAGGAIVLGFTPEEERDEMFSRELFFGLPVLVGNALVFVLIFTALIR